MFIALRDGQFDQVVDGSAAVAAPTFAKPVAVNLADAPASTEPEPEAVAAEAGGCRCSERARHPFASAADRSRCIGCHRAGRREHRIVARRSRSSRRPFRPRCWPRSKRRRPRRRARKRRPRARVSLLRARRTRRSPRARCRSTSMRCNARRAKRPVPSPLFRAPSELPPHPKICFAIAQRPVATVRSPRVRSKICLVRRVPAEPAPGAAAAAVPPRPPPRPAAPGSTAAQRVPRSEPPRRPRRTGSGSACVRAGSERVALCAHASGRDLRDRSSRPGRAYLGLRWRSSERQISRRGDPQLPRGRPRARAVEEVTAIRSVRSGALAPARFGPRLKTRAPAVVPLLRDRNVQSCPVPSFWIRARSFEATAASTRRGRASSGQVRFNVHLRLRPPTRLRTLVRSDRRLLSLD